MSEEKKENLGKEEITLTPEQLAERISRAEAKAKEQAKKEYEEEQKKLEEEKKKENVKVDTKTNETNDGTNNSDDDAVAAKLAELDAKYAAKFEALEEEKAKETEQSKKNSFISRAKAEGVSEEKIEMLVSSLNVNVLNDFDLTPYKEQVQGGGDLPDKKNYGGGSKDKERKPKWGKLTI